MPCKLPCKYYRDGYCYADIKHKCYGKPEKLEVEMDIDNKYNYHEHKGLHCCWNCSNCGFPDQELLFLFCENSESYVSPVGICNRFIMQDRDVAIVA